MAKKRKKRSSSYDKKSSKKTPNSEPKVTEFKEFGGCNFQLSPFDFDYIFDGKTTSFEDEEGSQTDLMNEFLVIQDNAFITSNKTIQSRPSTYTLFEAPRDTKFYGPAVVVGDEMYFSAYDEWAIPDPAATIGVFYAEIPNEDDAPETPVDEVTVTDNDGSAAELNLFTFLGYADDKLIGLTQGEQLWDGPIGDYTLDNANPVPDPAKLAFSNLTAKGTLTISATSTATEPYRVGITLAYVNKYGPTAAPDIYEFYASKPTFEWTTTDYVLVSGQLAGLTYDVEAVEFYYTEGEARVPAWLTRITLPVPNTSLNWFLHWNEFTTDAAAFQDANLTVPDENYTAGVPATNMSAHDGRLYFWGGEPYNRIWIGGNPGNRLSVGKGTGGGYVDCGAGVGNRVSNVLKFKTQQGASIVTALCTNPNTGKEKRYNLVESSLSLSQESAIKAWLAEEVAGAVGCRAPGGAKVAADGLYSISRYGLAITTLTMEYNSQVQVEYTSDPIEPVFLDQLGKGFDEAKLFILNDIIYVSFGFDDVLFCYDIDKKAWWTYTLPLDLDLGSATGNKLRNIIHIDSADKQEGIGFITNDKVVFLPTTQIEAPTEAPNHYVTLETAEILTPGGGQSNDYLSQLEFRFDFFVGTMDIDITMIDQFGRKIHVEKTISYDEVQYNLVEYVRVDKVVESYRVSLYGAANMRLTGFKSKTFPKSRKAGLVYGFDSRQSHTASGSIQRTFSSYNDLRKALIP